MRVSVIVGVSLYVCSSSLPAMQPLIQPELCLHLKQPLGSRHDGLPWGLAMGIAGLDLHLAYMCFCLVRLFVFLRTKPGTVSKPET